MTQRSDKHTSPLSNFGAAESSITSVNRNTNTHQQNLHLQMKDEGLL